MGLFAFDRTGTSGPGCVFTAKHRFQPDPPVSECCAWLFRHAPGRCQRDCRPMRCCSDSRRQLCWPVRKQAALFRRIRAEGTPSGIYTLQCHVDVSHDLESNVCCVTAKTSPGQERREKEAHQVKFAAAILPIDRRWSIRLGCTCTMPSLLLWPQVD